MSEKFECPLCNALIQTKTKKGADRHIKNCEPSKLRNPVRERKLKFKDPFEGSFVRE